MTDARKTVLDTLEMNRPSRVARQIWDQPWTYIHHPEQISQLKTDFPDDIVWCPRFLKKQPAVTGDANKAGRYIDEWGCIFDNMEDGIIGEVKNSLIRDEEWEDWENVRKPVELCDVDTEAVNAYCRSTDQFVLSGTTCRPFERLQFLAGSEKMFMDVLLQPDAMFDAMKMVHGLFCEEVEAWAKTDVDGIFFQDDWGTQKSLLINPKLWAELFKPMYKDYADIAKQYGKKVFMHSDGYIVDIYPHLIEIGVDAVNSQMFCMGVDKLAQFKGKITFWGELDRQGFMARGTKEEVDAAVESVAHTLWSNGGCIGQMDCGVGVKPENVRFAMEKWTELEKEICG